MPVVTPSFLPVSKPDDKMMPAIANWITTSDCWSPQCIRVHLQGSPQG